MRPHRPSWVHSHHDREPEPIFTLVDLVIRIDQIAAAQHLLISQGANIMATVADVQAALASNETKQATIIGLLQTEAKTLKDTQDQLAAAIAAGADPAALQAVVDKMTADGVSMDAAIASVTPPVVTPAPTPDPTPAPTTLG